jgi:ribosomal protein L24E
MATSTSFGGSSSRECQYCGEFVTDRYGRVFGDEDGVVHRCPECDSQRRLHRGSAAGRDVDWPDPQTHPERQGGDRA